ncbi:FKBP-type peptidyl-prolyl cis-trans isomerase [Bacteroidia bacterium]|nr:FKBP-type peptidyl-prolyl cis-trans isomerase [Bacteroidia bacterium]MDB9881979.1 FKBP-type peptidyl-prolyl cis-trans isomerase [Bacteroidia bacterium]
MKQFLFRFIIVFIFASCGDKPFQSEMGVEYLRGGYQCDDVKEHWLVDLEAMTSSDSMYLSTHTLNRKVELQVSQLDTNSTLFKLLSETCESDSIKLKIEAQNFYKPMGGSVPSHLLEDEMIFVTVWMRDKLNKIEYIAFKKIYESQTMANVVEQNNWNCDRDSVSHIYFERLKTNHGKRGSHDKVAILYSIKTLNNNILISSKPDDPLVYNVNDRGIIKGIRFMVEHLAIGESARAVIPSDYAYGPDGNGKVPGYMPIIIELEVLDKVN